MMMKSRISAAVSFLSTIIIILIEDSPKFMNSLKIKYLWILCTILFSLLPNIFSTKGHGGIHQCIHATTKIRKYGDGSTLGSCMACDPTLSTCDTLCQTLITNVIAQCKNICLPDGYFFDPKQTLSGCWKDIVKDLYIQIGRCGCNSAFSMHVFSLHFTLLLICMTFIWFTLF